MERLLVTLAIAAAVAAVAVVVRRRRVVDPPTQRNSTVPVQLDRADFDRPDAPWLVAVFSSATCDACAVVLEKAGVLRSNEVAVVDVEYGAARALHARYGIDTVPTLVIADHQGVVGAAFVGEMTATDLWAAIADLRSPGSVPRCGD